MKFYSPNPEGEVRVDGSRSADVNALKLINTWSNDDPELTLEALYPHETDRLTLQFVGWPHDDEFAPQLASIIRSRSPAVVIQEAQGYDASFRETMDTLDSLRIRGIGAYALHEETGKYMLIPDTSVRAPGWSLAYDLLGQIGGIKPFIRKMDLTTEQTPEDMQTLLRPSTNPWRMLEVEVGRAYDTIPFSSWVERMSIEMAVQHDFVNLRDKTMTQDISRIAANALARTEGPLAVMATHGATHTAMYRYFRRLGIAVTRDIVNTAEPPKGIKLDFGYAHTQRKSMFDFEPTPAKVETFLLAKLLTHKLFPTLDYLSYEQFNSVMQKGLKLLIEEGVTDKLVADWKGISESRTSFGSNKSKRRLDEGMANIAAQALQATNSKSA